MSPIEIFAIIVAVLFVVKMVVILIKPKAWFSVAKAMFVKPWLTMIVALVLALVVLKYLIASITIVQIFAVMLFMMLLMWMSFAAYSKEMLPMAKKLLKDRTALKRAWLSLIVWLALVVWLIYVLI